MILSGLGEESGLTEDGCFCSLTSSKYCYIGEKSRKWTHLRPNSKHLLKQHEFI